MNEERISTGIAGLDAMLRGGLRPGDSTLVVGSPGTGKTTLALHFLAAGVLHHEPAVFVTFEYLPQQIYLDAQRRGMPLRRWEETGLVKLICTTPDVLLAPTEDGSILEDAIHEIGARRVVIDSMAHFRHEGDGAELRTQISGILNHLRLTGSTALLTHEAPEIVSDRLKLSDWGLEFLVDNVIMLRFVELGGEFQKAISVLKFRSGGHDHKYRRVSLTDEGMVIDADFAGIENISGGTARRSIADRVKQLV